MAAMTPEERKIRGIVFDCTISMQNEITFLREKAMRQDDEISRILTINETIVKILGERLPCKN